MLYLMKTSAGMIIRIQMKTKYPKILAFLIKLKELWIRKNFVAFVIHLYIHPLIHTLTFLEQYPSWQLHVQQTLE